MGAVERCLCRRDFDMHYAKPCPEKQGVSRLVQLRESSALVFLVTTPVVWLPGPVSG